MSGAWHSVAALADILDPGLKPVKLPDGTPVCLVRRGKDVSAFLDECPHSGMPLSEGDVVNGCELECVWHGARFDCASGRVLRGPAEEDATVFAVEVRNGEVFVGARR